MGKGVLVLGLVQLMGCANPVVEDQDYSRECFADADCQPVFFGDICQDQDSCFPCANDVISSSDIPSYNADRDEAAQACDGPLGGAVFGIADCSMWKCSDDGACVDGTCTLESDGF